MHLDGVVLVQPAVPPRPPSPQPSRRTIAAARPPPAPKAVAAATPVAPVPARVAPVGYLVVKTTPAARLTVDGRDLGRWTPVPPANPIALPAGPHTLLFTSADGRKLEEQVQIVAGETVRLVRALP
jgi:hypothetical protein